MKELLSLYWTFAKMGAINFGGGYAMLPLLQEEIVEKRNWATAEEITDYFAIGQCTPGVIAVNVSTFIGCKKKGVLGGVFSTLGFISPSLIIILLISMILHNFSDNPYVLDAFAGIRVCVTVLILNAIFKLGKKSVVDLTTLIIFALIIILSCIFDVSPVLFVLAAGSIGLLVRNVGGKEE